MQVQITAYQTERASLLPKMRQRERDSLWPNGYITIQSLATYNNDNLAISIKIPKLVQKFAKY